MTFAETHVERDDVFDEVNLAVTESNASDISASDDALPIFEPTFQILSPKPSCGDSDVSHPPDYVSEDEVSAVAFCLPSTPLAKDALLLEDFPLEIARAALRVARGLRPGRVPALPFIEGKKGKRLTPSQRLARTAASTPWIAAQLLPQVESISLRFFEESIPTQAGWGLSLLVSPEMKPVLEGIVQQSTDDGKTVASQEAFAENEMKFNPNVACVLAFISFRVKSNVGIMEISKVGVRDELQHKGYGKRLVTSVVSKARQTEGVRFASLSSLKETVGFYKRIGFTDQGAMRQVSDDCTGRYEEGQVHMEVEFRKKHSRIAAASKNKRK